MRTLLDLLRRGAEEHPERLAIHFLHDDEGAGEVSWRRLWEGSRRRAAGLREQGLEPGAAVLVALPTGLPFAEALFGVLLAGGVPVPVAPPPSLRGRSLDPHRAMLAELARNCHAVAAICTQPVAAVIGDALCAVRPSLRCWVEPQGDAATVSDWPAAPDDLALLQYTSGSTRRPKGVELTHDNLLANAAAITQALFHEDARVVSWLPLYHDMGLIGTLLTSLFARVPLVLLPPQAFARDPACWLRALSEHRATVTAAPNFAFRYCCEAIDDGDLEAVDLSSVQAVLNGAEPIDRAAVAAFETRFRGRGLAPHVVRPVYGLAESAVGVTFADPGPLRLDAVDADRLERLGEAAPATGATRQATFLSVGRPLPGQEVRIADSSGRTLADRQVGEVLVRGRSVMRAYHRSPAASARALAGGWLHTGDLGYLAAGELYLTGRSKDLIIRHGRNYYPQDLEEQVRQVDDVATGAVVAFSVERHGTESVVVVAETRRGQSGERQRIERQIRTRLHDAFLFAPDEVLLVPRGAVPRTTSGKVRRRECRQRYLAGSLAGPGRRSQPPTES